MFYSADPTAVLDYTVDWSQWLQDTETISASTWQVPDGLTLAPAGSTNTDTAATVWITGGTVGTTYKVTNHITTTLGRQTERSFRLTIIDY